jgi:2,4-dienoyl-CoA reductase-like NADH-dependent reductase (Old Yellow Enzyme family)
MNGETIARREFLALSVAAGALAGSRSSAGTSRADWRLFSRGRIGKLEIANRLVRAATAENAWREGRMTDEGIGLYRGLAAGGVGLVITGYMGVTREGRASDSMTLVCEDRFVDGLGRIARVVHETNGECKVVAQLGHVGMQTEISEPVGPTTTAWPHVKAKPRALTTKEVEAIVASFAQAARRAREAGFDGVELHGAHGYLLSSFLSPFTNTRTDTYGGSLEKRATVVREIVSETRALVGPDFPILIKVNGDDFVPGGTDVDSFPQLASEIEKAGVQALEVSGNSPVRESVGAEGESYFLKYAQRLPLTIPVILTGGNRSVERLEKVAQAGRPDFFGLARPLLREPDLPTRWREGRGALEAACISCNRCIRGFGKGLPTRCRVEESDL